MAYNKSYYRHQKDRASARELSRIIIKLFKPKSAIDVGCSSGLMLSELRARGVKILGIDGKWIDESMLEIPRENFIRKDLAKPINLDRRFDICICLEVAEHIEKEHADTLIGSLTKLSDIVFFSAAIPMQLGTHHVNEQWQSYWASKFKKCGYLPIDCVRRRIWYNKDVALWYKQNTIVYVKGKRLDDIVKHLPTSETNMLDVVHPDLFMLYAKILPTPLIKGLHRFGGRRIIELKKRKTTSLTPPD